MSRTPPRTEGNMNAFQRVMHQWSELHPYNAVHAYRIARPLHAERLREAVRQVYRQAGLGFVATDEGGWRYRYETDPSPPLEVLDGGHHIRAVLRDLFANELNGPFERPRCRPMRITAVAAGPADHYVCVGYDHWAADSVSARIIMRRILGRYLCLALPNGEPPLEYYPDTYRRIFAPRLSAARLIRGAIEAAGQMIWRRTICRVPYTSVTHMPVGYTFAATADGTVDRLRHFARSLDATVHDVILAALGRAMAEHLPRRASRDGTCPMGIGTIVDTRGDAAADLSHTLGAFLSYYAVRFAAEPNTGLDEVTRRVAELTRPIKAQRAYLDAFAQMKLFSAVWPLLNRRRQAYFVRMVLPMTAGVSNVVVRDEWLDTSGSPVVDYFRGAPTGPMLPLTLAVTTFGERMNLGITYRRTGFTESRLRGILAMLQAELERPDRAGTAHRPTPSVPAEPTPERRSAAA